MRGIDLQTVISTANLAGFVLAFIYDAALLRVVWPKAAATTLLILRGSSAALLAWSFWLNLVTDGGLYGPITSIMLALVWGVYLADVLLSPVYQLSRLAPAQVETIVRDVLENGDE